jgi:hypothetical protein
VTSLEKRVMVAAMSTATCDGSQVTPYIASVFKVPAPKPEGEPKLVAKPTPTPTPRQSTRPKSQAPQRTVTPGAFCSPPGATGVGKNGATYTCKGPGQARWRR